MNITLDYLYIFVGLSGYAVRWWQVSKPFTFYLCLIVLVIAVAWWWLKGGADNFELGFRASEEPSFSKDIKECTKEQPYGYDANGNLNICIIK